jgi:hypothetical protein
VVESASLQGLFSFSLPHFLVAVSLYQQMPRWRLSVQQALAPAVVLAGKEDAYLLPLNLGLKVCAHTR